MAMLGRLEESCYGASQHDAVMNYLLQQQKMKDAVAMVKDLHSKVQMLEQVFVQLLPNEAAIHIPTSPPQQANTDKAFRHALCCVMSLPGL